MSYADFGRSRKGASQGDRIRTAVADIRYMLDRHGVRDKLAIALGPKNATALDEMLDFIVESADP